MDIDEDVNWPEDEQPVAANSRRSTTTDKYTDATCRHRRKNAIREKRSVSLHNCRPTSLRADNASVNTSTSTPLIDFAAVSEDVLMKPINPGGDSVDDLYDFPVYVPWKAVDFPRKACPTSAGLAARETAAVRANRRNNNDCGRGRGPTATAASMCDVCQKCRCTVCQRKCEFPLQVTVCNMNIESNPWWLPSWLPCVSKTTRCIATYERYIRERRAAAVSAAAAVVAAANQSRRNIQDASTRAPWFSQNFTKWFVFCPCVPRRTTNARAKSSCCASSRNNAKCVENCYGNVNVPHCYCVDWKMWKKIRGHCKNATDSGPRGQQDASTSAAGCR